MNTMISRTVLTLIICCIAMTGLFAGGEAEETTSTGAAIQTVTVVHFMGEQTKRNGLQAWVDSVAAENPNYNYEVEAIAYPQYGQLLKTRIAAGDTPDIMFGRPAEWREFVDKGIVMDLTGQPFTSRISDAAMTYASIDGKVWGLPIDHMYWGFFYNKDMFAEYGLKTPVTLNEMKKVLDTFKNNGVTPILLDFKDKNAPRGKFNSILRNLLSVDQLDYAEEIIRGGKNVSDYPVFREAMEVFDFYLKYKDPGAFGLDPSQALQAFSGGRSPLYWGGSWNTGDIRANNPAGNFGWFPIPWTNDTSKNQFGLGVDDCWMASASTKSPDAVLALFEQMASDEGVAQWMANTKLMSSMKGIELDDSEPIAVDVKRYMEKLPTVPYPKLFSGEVKTRFIEEIQQFATLSDSQRNVDEVMKRIEDAIEAAR